MEEDNKKPTHIIRFKDLVPQKNYSFTPLFIYANVFVFLLMLLFGMNVFSPSTDILVKWGGNIRYLTINGQLWRLFTCVFLHGGILHLIFNMFALLYVGSLLEKVIGKNKYIFAYAICGIAASISSLMMHENVVSVGASGAIFGLFGVLLPLLISKKINFPNISVDKLLLNISLFVLYNIVAGFNKSGIDNAAHIGGLFTGVIIGILYSIAAMEKIKPILAYTILFLSFCIFSVVVITNVSDKYGDYYRAIREFAENEQKTLWMGEQNKGAQISFYKDKLTKEGIDIWQRNISLLENLKNNDYEEQLVKFVDMLIDYSILRKKSCELKLESLENNSPEINQKLVEINQQIQRKLKDLEEFNIKRR